MGALLDGSETMTKKRTRIRWLQKSLIGSLVVLLFLLVIYLFNGNQIQSAREFRRGDQLAKADALLLQCWRLPGHLGSIEFETKLAAVQQGDLREETRWNDQAKTASTLKQKNLILESLCKGNLAAFRSNEAKLYADEILKGDSTNSMALWLRGRCWAKLQKESMAIADLERSVALSPRVLKFRLSLAELLQQQGYNHLATGHYRKLIEEKHFTPEVMIGLSRCQAEAGETAEAERTLQNLIQRYPSSSSALIERGRLQLRQGNASEAIKWATKAAQISPRSQSVNSFLLLCMSSQGLDTTQLQNKIDDDARTRVDLKKLLRTSPKNADAICNVGDFMISTGDELEGLGCYQRALGVDPDSVVAIEAITNYLECAGQAGLASRYRNSSRSPIKSSSRDAATSVSSEVPSSGLSLDLPAFSDLASEASPAEASPEEVRQLCGACHAYPTPDSFPKSAWRKEVQLGFDFLRDSSKSGTFPSVESVVRYYENRAPDTLPILNPSIAKAPFPIQFEVAGGGWLTNLPPYPASTHVNFVQFEPNKNLDLLVCDARLDRVLALRADNAIPEWTVLGPALVPCHAEMVDLDTDGLNDVVVACLGQFFPTDDKVGSVVWLHAKPDGSYLPITLLEGVGRVADVRPGDFNGDGRIDLVVAVFGWRNGGEILYLENRTSDWRNPQFETHVIDERHGAIHIPVADLNRDGNLDFVALISQEHEEVVAFLNDGKGQFDKKTIFTAPHPAYGSSGIELVDMDADSDLDVLLTNGDSLDRPYILKPYHGIQWLENDNAYPFSRHSVGAMYGVSRAVAADMDGDRDMDVVAVSFVPGSELPEMIGKSLPSAILYEQIRPLEFVAHVLEMGNCDHFSCAIADWNRDGQMDLSLGYFSWKRSTAKPDAALLLKGVKSE